MGLGEDMASTTLDVVKNVTPEMAKILAKLFSVVVDLGKGSGALAWDTLFKDPYEDMQRKSGAGKQDLVSFLYKHPNLTEINVDTLYQTNEQKKDFEKIMIKYRIPYAIQNKGTDLNGNGVPDVNMYIPDEYKFVWQEAKKEIIAINIERQANEKLHGKELEEKGIDIDNTRTMSQDQLNKVGEIVDKQYFMLNQNNPNWDNEKCFDEVLANAAIEKKTDIFIDISESTKKDLLIKELRNQLKEEDLLVVDKNFIFFKDAAEQYHYVDLFNKNYVSFNEVQMKELFIQQGINIEGCDLSKELEAYMKAANQTLKSQESMLETKYKEYSPIKKEFIKDSLLKSTQNNDIKIEQFDDPKLSISQMVMLREAQEHKLDMGEILRHNYSPKRIQALINLKELEKEVGRIDEKVYEIFKDESLTDQQVDAMLDAVLEQPDITVKELEEVAKHVEQEQNRLDNVIDGIEEVDREERKGLEEMILEAKEEKMREVIEKSPTIAEIGFAEKNELNKIYKDLQASHIDKNGSWKLYESQNKFDYYINEKNEVKVVCLVENVEKGPKLQDALSNTPKYEEEQGKWFTYKQIKGADVVVNEKGKARIEAIISKERARTIKPQKAIQHKIGNKEIPKPKGPER